MASADLLNLVVAHLRASFAIKRFVNDSLQHSLDLSLSELIVLLSAIAKPGLSQQSIAQSLHVSHPAISRQMANLQDKGYLIIKPDPDDRRKTCIYASSQGKTLTKQALQQINHQLASRLSDISHQNLDAQIGFNQQLADLLDDDQRASAAHQGHTVLYEVWRKLSLED